jgi:hypothetical protein
MACPEFTHLGQMPVGQLAMILQQSLDELAVLVHMPRGQGIMLIDGDVILFRQIAMLGQMPVHEGSEFNEMIVRQLAMLSQVCLGHFLVLG